MEKHSNDSSPGSPELLGAGWFGDYALDNTTRNDILAA